MPARRAPIDRVRHGALSALAKSPLKNLATFGLFLVSWYIFCLIRITIFLHVIFKLILISLNLNYLTVFSFVSIAINSYRDNAIGSDRDKPRDSSNVYHGTCF